MHFERDGRQRQGILAIEARTRKGNQNRNISGGRWFANSRPPLTIVRSLAEFLDLVKP